jgi:hypothetical protein
MRICRENPTSVKIGGKKSGNLYEDLSTRYCGWWHSFAVKALLCSTQYFCVVKGEKAAQKYKTNKLLPFHYNSVWKSRHHITLYVHCSSYLLITVASVAPGHAVAQLVEALSYKPAGHGFDSRWCQWIFFYWHNPSGRTVALGSTQPLTEMSTRNISWGGCKGGRCVGLTTLPPSCADCLEIWEPRPPGTLWVCIGL